MRTQIKIFETGIESRIMSRNKKFYQESLSQEEIDKIFLETRKKIGIQNCFDGKKIFQAKQKNEINKLGYPDGKYIVLTKDNMTKEDYWYEELPADILIISNNYPKIVVGNQMADCPIVIAEDRKKGVTALSHCGASYINRKLPQQTIKALEEAFNSNITDIYVYITSCASKKSYIYDCYPKWATNKEVWENSITKKEDNYYIDMIGAIKKQLKEIGIKKIKHSKIDTVTSPKFYSHIGYINGNKKKNGQNFVGFYYTK